ncbi:ligA [Symbiodinium necroappetens]|nr:ligA [Symbiodinium sp. KB8]CAE7897282.1 ligA [Symbiodinium necroappetens]
MSDFRCEFVEGSSSKFWEGVRFGNVTVVSFGKIGGVPSTSTKTHPDIWAATQFLEKTMDSKLKKGYLHTGKSKVTRKPGAVAKAKAKAKPKAKAKAAAMKAVMKTAMKSSAGGKLAGKILCFTGALSMPRSVATKMAKEAGARVTSSVSKTTDILVVGKDAGSKVLKGGTHLQYWDEKKFLKTAG